jgi:hypothetical protein
MTVKITPLGLLKKHLRIPKFLFRFFKNRNEKVVYTAIFGDYDDLKTIIKQKGFDYVVFTDDPTLKSNDYQVILCTPKYDDPCRNSRYYKINPHKVLKDYKYSIWIDASIKVSNPNLTILLEKYLSENDIALHINPARNCIYQAASNCIRLKKDDEKIIGDQMKKYRLESYPENYGLVSCGILFRRHTNKMEEFNDYWWDEIKLNSRRDQLSFNYVAWKTGIGFHLIPGHVKLGNVDGFTLYSHKK